MLTEPAPAPSDRHAGPAPPSVALIMGLTGFSVDEKPVWPMINGMWEAGRAVQEG